MRRTRLLIVMCALLLAPFAGVATAATSGFWDQFDTLHSARWSKGDHRLGRGYLEPENCSCIVESSF